MNDKHLFPPTFYFFSHMFVLAEVANASSPEMMHVLRGVQDLFSNRVSECDADIHA